MEILNQRAGLTGWLIWQPVITAIIVETRRRILFSR